MGLLTQALAGMVEGGANTGAKIMMDDMSAQRTAERDKALALKQEHMALLAHQRGEQSKIDAETRATAAKNAQLSDKFTVGGQVGTEGEAEAQVQTNKKALATKAAVGERASAAEIEAGKAEENALLGQELAGEDKYDPKVLDAINEARAPGKATPAETGLIDSYRKVGRVSEDAATAKAEQAIKIKDMDVAYREKALALQSEFKQQSLDLKAQMVAAQIARLQELNSRESTLEIQKLRLEQQKIESQRKSQVAADALLKQYGGSTTDMPTDALKSYNKHLKDAENSGDAVDIPTMSKTDAEKQAKTDAKSAGETNLIGTPKDSAVKIRAKELKTGGNSVTAQAAEASAKVQASNLPWQEKQKRLKAIADRAAGMQEKL